MEKTADKLENQNIEVGEVSNISDDIGYDFRLRYRILRRQISAFLRKRRKQKFIKILIITTDKPPRDFIIELQKQYPDKIASVLIPIVGKATGVEKGYKEFEYFSGNSINEGILYKFNSEEDNISLYGVYSDAFSNKENPNFKDIQNLAHFISAARICAEMLHPDIIQANFIPFFMGTEFTNERRKYKKVLSTPTLQLVDNISRTDCTEPFWAALNLVDRDGMKKLCRDKLIQKYLIELFSINKIADFKIRDCIELIYQNYASFRKAFSTKEDVKENIILAKLNARTLKLFPQLFKNRTYYHPYLRSIKLADYTAVLSSTYFNEITKELNKNIKQNMCSILIGYKKTDSQIFNKFTGEDFRVNRVLNKIYLLKELSYDRIRTKFTDTKLFNSEENKIYGYLDSIEEAALILCKFTDMNIQETDVAINTILKLFELKRNIQLILNISYIENNTRIKPLIDFLESNSAFDGRWIFIEGKINFNQFLAASDMIFLPQKENRVRTEHFEAINLGCVPVVNRKNGLFNDTVIDIFDNMLSGNGFKTEEVQNFSDEEKFFNAALKALNLFSHNPSSWNKIIKNCLNTETGWNFEVIEKYNSIYNKII